ncbi:MAG: IS4 family transposase, partial [Gallionella sp.]
SALAIFKRLMVVAMACVTVWAIAADKHPETIALRTFLIKLSGRQMRHDVEFTHPALLAGLWVFLSMLEIMQNYSQNELEALKTSAMKFFGGLV